MWPGGVLVASTPDRPSKVAGIKLALALNSVGIFSTFMSTLDGTTPRLFVTVGPKPDADDPLLKINIDALRNLDAEMQKISE
jgi:hypothetical protein